MNSYSDYVTLLCDIYEQIKDKGEELFNLFLSQATDMIDDYDSDFSVDCKIVYLLNALSDKDFYPPEDKRILQSRLFDVDDTNNFNQFTKEYFELCDEEEIYD